MQRKGIKLIKYTHKKIGQHNKYKQIKNTPKKLSSFRTTNIFGRLMKLGKTDLLSAKNNMPRKFSLEVQF